MASGPAQGSLYVENTYLHYLLGISDEHRPGVRLLQLLLYMLDRNEDDVNDGSSMGRVIGSCTRASIVPGLGKMGGGELALTIG